MALPDPQHAPRDRRRDRRDRALVVLAASAMGAAGALWIVELSTGEPVLVPGSTEKLLLVASLLTVAWLITSLERRLVQHLRRIEGARYRDGYAAGYLDAAVQSQKEQYGRPSLRPVK
jgi:hypothetical protein